MWQPLIWAGRTGPRPGILECLTALVLLVSSGPFAQAEPLHLSGSSWIHDAPTKIAELEGFFRGEGPGIEVSYETSGKASLERLLAGEVDFALAASIPVARALLTAPESEHPEPDDLVVLATVSQSNQTHQILALPERGIEEPGDLAGRRLGVLFDTSAEFFWSVFAPLNGLDAEDVELVDMPLEDMARGLRDGKVDAVVTWDPWVYRIDRDLEPETVTFAGRQIYTLNWLLVTRRGVVERHPDVCDRLLAGYLEANEILFRNPDRAIDLQSAGLDLPADYLASMHDKLIFHLGLNWSVLTNMEQAFDWMSTKLDPAAVSRPGPERYVAPGPMLRVAPRRMLLPNIWQTAETERVR